MKASVLLLIILLVPFALFGKSKKLKITNHSHHRTVGLFKGKQVFIIFQKDTNKIYFKNDYKIKYFGENIIIDEIINDSIIKATFLKSNIQKEIKIDTVKAFAIIKSSNLDSPGFAILLPPVLIISSIVSVLVPPNNFDTFYYLMPIGTLLGLLEYKLFFRDRESNYYYLKECKMKLK